MEEIELAVFDLDGVIADTEPLHKVAKQELLVGLGVDPDMDMTRFVGRPNVDFWKEIIKDNHLSCSIDDLELRQYESILRQMKENSTPTSAGLNGLLERLSGMNIRCALCSSSDRFYVDRVLEFYHLRERLAPTVAGDEVPRKKPAPDGYLRVTELAGIAPGRAVAIEDSAAGLEAASVAGLRTIGYRNPTSGQQDLRRADWVVDSLAEAAALFAC